MMKQTRSPSAYQRRVAELGPVRRLKDEEVSHGEMEGLAPDRAGNSG
jgi:hypothetical protein